MRMQQAGWEMERPRPPVNSISWTLGARWRAGPQPRSESKDRL